MKTYFSNGKFLLTGEYFVLQGALALSLPLRLGQSLAVEVDSNGDEMIDWEADIPSGKWFSVRFDKQVSVVETTDADKADMLRNILLAVRKLNPKAFTEKGKYTFTTRLDFDKEWGLGSSSTLVSNLARWAEVNPYDLLAQTFGGSGFDIACATASQPILYQLKNGTPEATEIEFNPPFADKLYFVYQGHKQSSRNEVKAFKNRILQQDLSDDIDTISELTLSIAKTQSFSDFCALINLHETIVGESIGREPLKNSFPDFNGSMKSLGAWGGDFFLAASEMQPSEVISYFENKGFTTIFQYDKLVRNDK